MLPEQAFALEWLHKARNDLLSAKVVLESEYGITDIPCFHAQQTVEKALKGLLTWRNISFGKTHDLLVLLAKVVQSDAEFGDYRELCQELAEFAVDVRYPGGISEPPEGEALRFITGAEEVLVLIERIFGVE